MGTLTAAQCTTQVRPWPAGGAWNNVTLLNSIKWADKGTTFGVALHVGALVNAVEALNQFMNQGSAGTAAREAQARAHGVGLEIQEVAALATALAGNGQTTNVLDRGVGVNSGPANVVIVTAVGATPTCTYQLEGSLDGSAWSPLSSADSGTPTVFSTATFVITSATTTTRIVDPAASWRFIRLTMSANTNVTNTITANLG